MHSLGLILTLTGGLTAALVFGFLTQKLRLSPIVGYLIAGIVVGPFTPGFVAQTELAQELAEVGVILLMFGVGLQFHVEDLVASWKFTVPGATLRMLIAIGLGVLAGRFAGWSTIAGVVFGVAIAISSTVVILRVLADCGAVQTTAGRAMVGWLVVEDVLTVVALVVLPVISGAGSGGVAVPLLLAFGKLVVLVGFTMFIGTRVLPRILAWIAKTNSRELFTLSVLVVALGIAVGSAELFGASMALGAFLAGLVVGRSDFAARAASEALPMRDAFAVLFFVSVGMLFDPSKLAQNAPMIAIALGVIMVARPLVGYALARLLRQPPHTAVNTGLALAPIGEFSFIVAALGKDLGVLPSAALDVIVASAIVSITVAPIMTRLVDPIAKAIERNQPPPSTGIGVAPKKLAGHTIVVGYGPVGRTVRRLLAENAIEAMVIELNLETVQRLGKEGVHAIYGDATQPEILERAGVREARSLIFAASGTPADHVIRAAKDLNPQLRTLARSAYVREVEAAQKAGADIVVAAEVEVALAMTEHILGTLGATPEQLDRARDRARSEI